MPYDGLFSFLRRTCKRAEKIWKECVNALWRAFFISTVCGDRWAWTSQCMCQCPMTGFFHFYVCAVYYANASMKCVNALWRAFFISTDLRETLEYDFNVGVNALWRAFFISTAANAVEQYEEMGWCQCPMTGFFHFYKHIRKAINLIQKVSMPYDGLFSFLHLNLEECKIQEYGGVNALWRAFFISTYWPLWCRCSCTLRGCQCPMTGFFHFYPTGIVRTVGMLPVCVNALWRAFSFLQRRKKWKKLLS